MTTVPSIRTAQDASFRRTRVINWLAISLIGVLTLTMFILVDTMIDGQKQTAAVVNMAGRQRMLSQRIGKLALELALPSNDQRDSYLAEQLELAIERMHADHLILSEGSAVAGVPAPSSAELLAIYRAEPDGLDARVKRFHDLARQYLALSADQRTVSPLLEQLLDAGRRPLLEALDHAVTQYQAESEAGMHRVRTGILVMAAAVLLALFLEARFIVLPSLKRLRDVNIELLDLALTDPLTGSMNRRHLVEIAGYEFARARHRGEALSVLMIDIDHFKAINDSWGHAVGDRAILALAKTALAIVGADGVIGRIGGEEFAVVLPDTTLSHAISLAERLRAAVAKIAVDTGSSTVGMAVSVGVAEMTAADADFMSLLQRADQALYLAKRRGRDRVSVWSAVAAE